MHTNQRDAVTRMERRVPFRASALSGDVVDTFSGGVGRLPKEWRERFYADAKRHRETGLPMYVVRSYETPIAWVVGSDVVIPDLKFSVTTSRHQGIARRALRPAERAA